MRAKRLTRVLIGGDAYVIDAMQRLLPTSYQKLVTTVYEVTVVK